MGEYTVAKSAIFFEDVYYSDLAEHDVEVSYGRDEYDGYTLPAGTLIARKANEEDAKVKYVFIPAVSDSNIEWGKLININMSKETVEIAGSTATKLGENSEEACRGDLVGYTTNNTGDTARIVKVITPVDFSDTNDGTYIVDGNIDEADDDEDIIPVYEGADLDKNEIGKTIKNFKIVVVTLKKDKSTGEIEIVSVNTEENKGFDALKEVAVDWDRIVIDEENKVIFVLHGVFDKNAELEDGVVSKRAENAPRPTPDPEPENPTESEESEPVEEEDSQKVESQASEDVESQGSEMV
jgi:hypothetical protein